MSTEERRVSQTSESEDLVILRRKCSTDPQENVRVSKSSATEYGRASIKGMEQRPSQVFSVCEDLMSGEPLKMMGYMEKRSKLIGWKKYWFVLDGQLLTYFKSKAEYESLSPFSGSITLGNVSAVRPIQIKHCKGYPMQIVSRNHVYLLRCNEKTVLEQWVLALQETITGPPPVISSPLWTDPGVQFYRYAFADSAWSIDESETNITGSLSNLPKNFYLKHEKSETSGNALNSGLKTKCVSCLSFPTDVGLDGNSNLPLKRSNVLTSNSGSGKIRQSASMFLLESSPEASELKRELATKLSIGTITPSSIRGIKFESNETRNSPSSSQKSVSDTGKVDEPLEGSSSVKSLRVSRNTNGSLSQASSLASIAEGFEPNLSRQLPTLPFQRSNSTDTKSRKKKKGIGNFIQKIFRKDSDLPSENRDSSSMIISGPVDLRPKRNSNNRKHSNPPVNPEASKVCAVINELKDFQRKNSSGSEGSNERVLQESRKLTQIPSAQEHKTLSNSESYEDKIAKFNHLSTQVNPTLMAPMSRTTSCRLKSTEEFYDEPPILPPKKRNIRQTVPQFSSYDTPKNNLPIQTDETLYDHSLTLVPNVTSTGRERKISLRELFVKKNSAPEIILNANFDFASTPKVEQSKTENESDSCRMSLEVGETGSPSEPVYSSVAPDLSNEALETESEGIYEEIKYATVEMALVQCESVQEDGDEETELYDTFGNEELDFFPVKTDFRNKEQGSGMAALEEYLLTEADPNSCANENPLVNRLGKSLAVQKLENLLHSN